MERGKFSIVSLTRSGLLITRLPVWHCPDLPDGFRWKKRLLPRGLPPFQVMINPFENGLICGARATLEYWEFWAVMSLARGSEAGAI